MNDLKETYFKYFKKISDIPRKSGNEKSVANYLINFAKENNLKYFVDDIYNVIIYKEASYGYEEKEVLGLQSHTDMICEKIEGSKHNFLKDPLDIYVEGDYIKARGTSLGADNGVGVSYMLAILSSSGILSPRLECIFTVQEETTMNGAKYIDETKISAKKIISFDNFSEDTMWISSSNCKEYTISIKNEYIQVENYNTYEINLNDFKGGHSGLDIADETRINPIKLAIETISKKENVYINKIKGGSRVNIIPRDCKVEFSLPEYINEEEMNLLKIQKVQNNNKMIKSSQEIIKFVKEFENGMLQKDNEENIILSANLGVIESTEEETILKYSVRINDKKLGEQFIQKLENKLKQTNFKIKEYNEMLGYESKEDSKLVDYCTKEYYKTFKKEIKKIKVQACLECGFFKEKIQDLEYLSIAPNIYNAHSPSECFSITSSQRIWEYILNLLRNW